MGQVRCDHCGWGNNPEGAKKCQKCNQELVYLPPVPIPAESEKKIEPSLTNCRNCGYPMAPDSSFCPNCGTPLKVAPVTPAVNPDLKKTVRVGETPRETPRTNLRETPRETPQASCDTAGFRLRPVDMNVNEAYAFGGDADAAFEFADGQWFISDRSGTNSAYVCATRRIALQKGDVVLIGGRRYIFE